MKKYRERFAERLDSLSYSEILSLWVANILLFTTFYLLLSRIPGNGPVASVDLHSTRSVWDILYFSIITATSTGYGDIVPLGFARGFAAVESFSGILLFALFVSKLLSRRQDIALREVHQLAFQTEFHNTREDLYTARKDLDLGIEALAREGKLSNAQWEQLSVALQQIGHLMHEIPGFYEHENELYTIDSRREKLLIEAVGRTLSRVLRFVESHETAHSGAILEDPAREALAHLLDEGLRIMPLWRKHSAHGDSVALGAIAETLEKVRKAAKH